MATIRVRYKGVADERVISAKDLESVGVTVDEDLVWNRRNLFSLEIQSNDKLEEVLRAQGHFTISSVDDNNGDSVIAVATDTDSEGDVLVDGDTGASTKVKRK